MALINRLAGIPEGGQTPEDVAKIGFNQILAALHEIKRGNLTQAGVVAAFNLDAGETTTLTNIYNKLNAFATAGERRAYLKEVEEVLHLCELGVDDSGNGGLNYTDAAVVTTRINAI